MFEQYVIRAQKDDWTFVTLGELVNKAEDIPEGRIAREAFPGREGWLGVQA